MLGLGYVYRCFFGKTKDELAPPPPLKKRKLMERRVENDASSNLAQAKEVRATCEEAREASKERIRQEKERHSGVMSLLNKQLMGCEANLDEAEKDAFTADKNDEERALDDESVKDDADKESAEDADESSEECELSKGADATAVDNTDDEDEDEATISTPADGRCFLR